MCLVGFSFFPEAYQHLQFDASEHTTQGRPEQNAKLRGSKTQLGMFITCMYQAVKAVSRTLEGHADSAHCEVSDSEIRKVKAGQAAATCGDLGNEFFVIEPGSQQRRTLCETAFLLA